MTYAPNEGDAFDDHERLPPVIREFCGTKRGYRAHTYRNEKPCDPCRVTHNASQERYRKTRSNWVKIKITTLQELQQLIPITRPDLRYEIEDLLKAKMLQGDRHAARE